jgi:hypothetical protein
MQHYDSTYGRDNITKAIQHGNYLIAERRQDAMLIASTPYLEWKGSAAALIAAMINCGELDVGEMGITVSLSQAG